MNSPHFHPKRILYPILHSMPYIQLYGILWGTRYFTAFCKWNIVSNFKICCDIAWRDLFVYMNQNVFVQLCSHLNYLTNSNKNLHLIHYTVGVSRKELSSILNISVFSNALQIHSYFIRCYVYACFPKYPLKLKMCNEHSIKCIDI